MRIVHFSTTPLAGAPHAISDAINKWTTHESRWIHGGGVYSPPTRTYPIDISLPGRPKECRHLIANCDVLHVHNYNLPRELRKVSENKPTIVQYHSVPRKKSKVYPASPQYVIAQPLHFFVYDDCEALPNIVPIWDAAYRPTWKQSPPIHEKLRVAFAPSHRRLGAFISKGVNQTDPILRRLAKDTIEYDLIENVSLEECLKRKARAHVVIDEVVTGNFHRSSLESLAQGSVVIAQIGEKARDFFDAWLGPNVQHPWVSATPETLRATILSLVESPETVQSLRIASRRFMEDHWDDRELIKLYISAYERVLSE